MEPRGSGSEPDPLTKQDPGPTAPVKDGAFGRRRRSRSKILDRDSRAGVLCYQGLEGQVCLPGLVSPPLKSGILETLTDSVGANGANHCGISCQVANNVVLTY